MNTTCLQIIFSNDFSILKAKLNSFLEYLASEIPFMDKNTLFDLRVIYNELLHNAIIHGNKQDMSKKIELVVMVENSFIVSVIRDEGIGFDYTSLFKPAENTNNIFYEHGRGLKLVLGLADSVEWNDTGNEVKFLKHI